MERSGKDGEEERRRILSHRSLYLTVALDSRLQCRRNTAAFSSPPEFVGRVVS